MASSTKFSYQRLRKIPSELEEDEAEEGVAMVVVRRKERRSWLRLHSGVRWWRRPRVRVVGLRKLRRKAREVGAAVRKVVERLKEGRPYIGDLFAGNYMFMQVNPSPTVAYLEKKPYLASRRRHHHHHAIIIPPHSTRFNIPRVVS